MNLLSTFWIVSSGPLFYLYQNLVSFIPRVLPLSTSILYPVASLRAGLCALTSYFWEPWRPGCPGTLIPSCRLPLQLPVECWTALSQFWLWFWMHQLRLPRGLGAPPFGADDMSADSGLFVPSQAPLTFPPFTPPKLFFPCDPFAIDGFSPNCSFLGSIGIFYHLILVKMVSLWFFFCYPSCSMGIWD